MEFQVFKDGKLAEDFTLSAAYMFGADTIPIYSTEKIEFKNGLIRCTRKGVESAGLALLWPVEGSGRILLPTTRLPERKKPYNLNVELARARLMQITLKREDWTLFEETDSFAELAHEAQTLFIESLKCISEPGKASVLADESLKKAVDFSEQLSLKHADRLLALRCKSKTLGRHSLGCLVEPELLSNEKYRKWLFDMFGFVTIPLSWARLEPEKGRYDFSDIDNCLKLLGNRRLAIFAGPVLSFSKEHLPQWLVESGWKFEKIREVAYEFVSALVGRYVGLIHGWQVLSGLNAFNYFRFNFEQIIEMTRAASLAAKSADPKSRKIVEIAMPWGEYYACDRETIPPLVYVDVLLQTGISFDAFGLSLHFGKDQPGMHIRDMMQISSRLDFFGLAAKPLHITGVAVPDHCAEGVFDCLQAGMWRKEWDKSQQSHWLDQLYRIILSKPFIHSVTYSGLMDNPAIPLPGAGLLNENGEPKKSFVALVKLQKLLLKK